MGTDKNVRIRTSIDLDAIEVDRHLEQFRGSSYDVSLFCLVRELRAKTMQALGLIHNAAQKWLYVHWECRWENCFRCPRCSSQNVVSILIWIVRHRKMLKDVQDAHGFN